MREVLIALSVVLLGGGLLTAVWNIVKDRRKAPIEQRDAHVAAADTIQQMAMREAEAARASAARAEAAAEKARASGEACRDRIEALERSHAVMERAQDGLRSSLIRWEAWWGDLAARWHHHRVQDYPPPRPEPHPDLAPDDGQPTNPTT